MSKEASARIYSVRRPAAPFFSGMAVAVFAGLIGLGGAEFRLPLLIAFFDIFPHRAVRINLLISFATLVVAGVARKRLTNPATVWELADVAIAMVAGGLVAAWLGAGILRRIPTRSLVVVIAVLLLLISALFVAESLGSGTTLFRLNEPSTRVIAAGFLGLMIGSVISLLGVAGGEFIIPILVFVFGADLKTAGTASVLISLPIVLAGVARHWLTGHFRSRSMLTHLALPMSVGSIIGAAAGGYIVVDASTSTLRIFLAVILFLYRPENYFLTHTSVADAVLLFERLAGWSGR